MIQVANQEEEQYSLEIIEANNICATALALKQEPNMKPIFSLRKRATNNKVVFNLEMIDN